MSRRISTFGLVGDEVVFYFDGGSTLEAMNVDEKSQEYVPWNTSPANGWGNDNGACVVEPFVSPWSITSACPALGCSGQRVAGATNLGSYV